MTRQGRNHMRPQDPASPGAAPLAPELTSAPSVDPARNPCQTCGACCAQFRVSFYWAEADDAIGGWVPVALTKPIDPQRRAMRGTLSKPVRCVALVGELASQVSCSIYDKRPSPCREFDAWDDQGRVNERCTKARAGIGLPPLAARSS
jgi:Fe-S-cluster containining protein